MNSTEVTNLLCLSTSYSDGSSMKWVNINNRNEIHPRTSFFLQSRAPLIPKICQRYLQSKNSSPSATSSTSSLTNLLALKTVKSLSLTICMDRHLKTDHLTLMRLFWYCLKCLEFSSQLHKILKKRQVTLMLKNHLKSKVNTPPKKRTP